MLKYDVGDQRCDPNALVERLGAAGCTDALVGTGEHGYLALEFTPEADSVECAVRAALVDVQEAIPSARLVNISPEISGL
ncbi:hypothetical protein [Halioxenophilus aromaticivorans]|uniref:Transcriptional regulator n=2 Tax=Halioxenophilus aromaticivorans TaxID=1306992 RepID=A0AAV3U825_9ALTE